MKSEQNAAGEELELGTATVWQAEEVSWAAL